MGIVFQYQGDYDRALECYRKQLSIAEELGDKKGISFAAGNMGALFYETDDYQRAAENLDRAISISREIGLKGLLAEVLRNEVRLSLSQNLITQAQEECLEALTLACELKNEDLIKQAEILSHKVEFAAGDDAIRSVAAEALEGLLGKTDNEEHHAEIHYELWQMHSQLGNNKEADSHREDGIKLYKALYVKIPKYEYKKRIEELKNVLLKGNLKLMEE